MRTISLLVQKLRIFRVNTKFAQKNPQNTCIHIEYRCCYIKQLGFYRRHRPDPQGIFEKLNRQFIWLCSSVIVNSPVHSVGDVSYLSYSFTI